MTQSSSGLDPEPKPALVSAISTQHFALQASIGSATAEAGSRASIYMYSLSGALVAIGFADRTTVGFLSFLGAVLPAVFVLGLFTIIRLVDILFEHVQARAALVRILDWYRTLTVDPELLAAFGSTRSVEGAENPALRFGALTAGMSTLAAMIATINAFVGAVGVVLVSDRLGLGAGIAWLCGAVTLMALVAAFFAYQTWRLRDFLSASTH